MKYITIAILLLTSTTLFSQDKVDKPIHQDTLDALRHKLEVLFMKDQAFRRIYTQAEEVLGKDSDDMEYFWEVVEKQDLVLEKELSSIIDQYGWLGISQVGRRANTAQWGIVQHARHEYKLKYAPLMKASVLAGESQPSQYARLIDWMNINNGQPQVYGSATKVTVDGTRVFYEIAYRDKVNERRAEIGLSTIEEYANTMGIDWK